MTRYTKIEGFVTVGYVSVIGRPSSYDEPDKYPTKYVSGGPTCAYDELVRRTQEDDDYWEVIVCPKCKVEIAPFIADGNFYYFVRLGRKYRYLTGCYHCDCGENIVSEKCGYL